MFMERKFLMSLDLNPSTFLFNNIFNTDKNVHEMLKHLLNITELY